MKRSFFYIGDDGDNRGKRKRWMMNWHVTGESPYTQLGTALAGNVKRIRTWNSRLVMKAKSKGPVEDIPWSDLERPLVSDRVRKIIQKVAPRQVQFLPVDGIVFRGDRLPVGRYWIANYLLEIDCVNWRKSIGVSRDGGLYAWRAGVLDLAIHARKVPENAKIFVVANVDRWCVCDDDVVHALQDAGIIGGRIEPVIQ